MRPFLYGAGLLACGLPGLHAAPPRATSSDWTRKIDPRIIADAARDPAAESDCLIILTEQADLSEAALLPTKLEKGRFVFQRLTEVAARTQPAVLSSLSGKDIFIEPLWVANMIHVRGSFAHVLALAERADVARVEPNPLVRFAEPVEKSRPSPMAIAAIEPGVSLIRAPNAWARGYTGQGIVVGGMDTGYRWTHAAVKRQYRGWNGAIADHNYNWHDAIHTGGGVCGANSGQPCDDDGHGTHTMGTMVGSDGGLNQIGVAPGAQWIGCRCMDQGNGTPATYSECMQWFIAPTDSSGGNPDPSKSPDVINNSWGCPASEGCAPTTLQLPIENVRAAGIVVVSAAGNSGPACSTVEDAPAIYAASITVAATTTSNTIASFSSRGLVTSDGSNRMKPNVAAPGVSVRSAYGTSDTTYLQLSGTSMAAPHTVGTIALVLSAHPQLIGNPGAVQNLLEQSALRLTGTQTCGGIPGSQIPNPTFGWGRIDAYSALGLDDTDGDGLPDWQEYLARTSLTSAGSYLRITAVDRVGGDCRISFPSVLLVQYRLEAADNLVAPMWTTIADNVPGTGGVIDLMDPNVPGSIRFYRLVTVP